jgi:hypothetical protein
LDSKKKIVKLTGFSRFLEAFYARLHQHDSAVAIRRILARDSTSRADNLVFGVVRFLITSFKQRGSAHEQKEVNNSVQ